MATQSKRQRITLSDINRNLGKNCSNNTTCLQDIPTSFSHGVLVLILNPKTKGTEASPYRKQFTKLSP
jgi:hypothetical protein